MKFDKGFAIVLSAIILIASFKYERDDMGCESCFNPSVSACSDYNSVYVRNSKYSKDDSPDKIKRKLKKLLDFDQSSGSWKRCVLWSFFISILNYLMYHKGGCIDDTNIQSGWLFMISWIVNFSILYALKSFESFHIFRVIHKVGCQLVSKM
jgi:hypothetical protein